MADVNWPYMMRRQSTAAWTADTVALLDGEPGKDSTTGEMAIGDGTTLWPALVKFIPGSTTLTSLGVSAFAQTLLDDANASAFMDTLGGGNIGKLIFALTTPAGDRFIRVRSDGSVNMIDGSTAAIAMGAGSANGLATLDGSGTIPTSQLPASIVGQVEYQGTWSASANTPAIPAAATGNKGHYYIATTAVASSHGYSNVPAVDFAVGDWIISNGSSWSKVDNTDAVASVAGRAGAIVLTSADLTDRTVLGANWFNMSTPAGVRFARINSDGSITQRTAAELVTDLSLTLGVNTQAHDADLDAIAGLTPANDDLLQRKAGAWTNRTLAQVLADLGALKASNNLSDVANPGTSRTNLGLGTIAVLNEVEVSVGSGQNTQSTSPVDITGLSASMDANGRYAVDIYVLAESANVATGIGLSLNGSAAATYVAARFEGHQGAGNFVSANITAYNGGTAAASVANANTPYYFQINALVTNGASASTLAARFFRGGSANDITIRSARMKVRKLA